MRADRVMFLIEGLSDTEINKTLLLGEGTVNLFPDMKGYLVNYPGKRDYFDRTDPGQDPPTENVMGTAPALENDYTVVYSFVDYLGDEHLVYCKGDSIYEALGNGFRKLATLSGKSIDDLYHPYFLLHEKKLIILNAGDFPKIWDGVDGVELLGVQEVPIPPLAYLVTNLHTTSLSNTITPYQYPDVWFNWAAGKVSLGPNLRDDSGGTEVAGWYQMCVQFVDQYGNKGKASPPCAITTVPPTAGYTSHNFRRSLMCEWTPPMIDPHVRYVIQGRTLTLNPDDRSPLGSVSVMYEETYTDGATLHRRLQRLTDAGLAGSDLIDFEVGPPPSAVLGASFSGRIWLIDENGEGHFSDLLLTGQYRVTQRISFYSKPVAILPAGDRLFVIGRKSTEVYYESASGPSLLERDIENGAIVGSSFVVIGDGAVFGLWNTGFGFYDGAKHTSASAPEYINDLFLDDYFASSAAKKIGDWYYLPIRIGQVTSDNSHIVMYNFKTLRWYLIEESVRDITHWEGVIIGCKDSLFALFLGEEYPEAKIVTAGFTSGVNTERQLRSLKVLMEASSTTAANLEIMGDTRVEYTDGSFYTHPSKNASRGSFRPEPYWNSLNDVFPASWSAPNDMWFGGNHGKPIVGFYHRLDITFPIGFPVRVKGIEVGYSVEHRTEAE